MFDDRTDAGERLASLLLEREVEADIVLAIPRGGLPVGRAVADALSVPLDVVVARKMGAPGNPELAVGAVASDGTVWLNEDLIDRLDVDDAYLGEQRERERAAAEDKLTRYRADRGPLDLDAKDVLIVDDGVATGATTTACVRQVRAAGADRVLLAVPVGPPDALSALREETDAVYAVETPASFGAVGRFYRRFDQVTDEEAMAYLSG